jgi:hypothetical protein
MRGFILLAALVVLVGTALIVIGDTGDAIPLVIVALLWVAYFGWAFYAAPIRRYRRSRRALEQTYRFDDAGVTTTFATGMSQLKWEHFVDVLPMRQFYLLRHRDRRLVNIVLRRALAASGDVERFERLIASKLPLKGSGQEAAGRGRTPSSSKP